MAASLSAEELGKSFAIQSYGDLAARRALHPRADLFGCPLTRISCACTPAADLPSLLTSLFSPGAYVGTRFGAGTPLLLKPLSVLVAAALMQCCRHCARRFSLPGWLAAGRCPRRRCGFAQSPALTGLATCGRGPLAGTACAPQPGRDTSACMPACSGCQCVGASAPVPGGRGAMRGRRLCGWQTHACTHRP